jgi:hypothetical protein
MFTQADRLRAMNKNLIGKTIKGFNFLKKGFQDTAKSLKDKLDKKSASSKKSRLSKSSTSSDSKSSFGKTLGKTVAVGVGGLSMLLASAYAIAKS